MSGWVIFSNPLRTCTFVTSVMFSFFLSKLTNRNVTGIQWVASEAWVTATLLTSPRFHPLLEGTLGFSFPGVNIPALKEFLLDVRPSGKPGTEFIDMFWEELFGCRLKSRGVSSKKKKIDAKKRVTGLDDFGGKSDSQNKNSSWSLSRLNVAKTSTFRKSADNQPNEKPVCTGSEDVRSTESSYTDMSQFRISYNVYKAVYAIAHALHTLLNCDSVDGNNGMCMTNQSVTSKKVN